MTRETVDDYGALTDGYEYGAWCVYGHVVEELDPPEGGGGGFSRCPVCGTEDVMEGWVPSEEIEEAGEL